MDIFLYGIFLIGILAWVFYFRPKHDIREDSRIFDNRVLATIDGLYISGMKFGCTGFEMRAHARRLLEKAHALPDNQTLLSHTIYDPESGWNGHTFHSHIGLNGEHITFALLCIIDYTDDSELVAQCEGFLREARYMESHYH